MTKINFNEKTTIHDSYKYQIQQTRRTVRGDIIGNVSFRTGITNNWQDNVSHMETRLYNVIQQEAPLHSVHVFHFTKHHYKHNIEKYTETKT